MKRVIRAAGSYDMPERELDPPESREPEVVDNIPYTLELYVDTEIVVEDNGDWDYVDQTWEWAEDNGNEDWILDNYEGMYCHIRVDDSVGVVEKLDELIMDKIPTSEPGTHKITGMLNLEYTINNLYVDNLDDVVYDDDTDVVYYQEGSKISDFECTPVEE